MKGPIADVVMLTPGFLGFDHFGGFPYFAQAVATAVRVALEERRVVAPSELAVVASETIPAGSLAKRQASFFAQLETIVRGLLRGPEGTNALPRIHIIGHSTGGVDAELFLSPRPLDRPRWSAAENRIRQAIRSVVSIAAPLSGTGLAESALCKLLASDGSVPPSQPMAGSSGHASVLGARQLAEVLLSVAEVGLKDATLSQFIAGSLDDLDPVVKFVGSVLRDRGLLTDLSPAAMSRIGARIVPDPALASSVRVARFVTVARREPEPCRNGKLFEVLYALTARDQGVGLPPQRVDALNRAIDAGHVRVIGATPLPGPLTIGSNDGIVNTARQIPPAVNGDLRGHVTALVVADHLDVLGGFPMTSSLGTGPAPDDFLSSGSNFRSPEFSELYRAAAAEIAESIESHRATPAPRSAPRQSARSPQPE